jgi:hypothetical protein
MASQEESITRTTESGAFIRTIVRKGKRRKIETKRLKKIDKKVILGHLGEFEVYIYPYDFPDTVFIGSFPVSTQIDTSSFNQLIACYNKIRAYFRGDYYNKDGRVKEANSRRHTIQRAYNTGLDEKKKAKNKPVSL